MLKDGLDLFAELLLYHGQLCRACYAAADSACDRAVYRNAFKALIDIVRYSEVPDVSAAVESRQRATARIVRDTGVASPSTGAQTSSRGRRAATRRGAEDGRSSQRHSTRRSSRCANVRASCPTDRIRAGHAQERYDVRRPERRAST